MFKPPSKGGKPPLKVGHGKLEDLEAKVVSNQMCQPCFPLKVDFGNTAEAINSEYLVDTIAEVSGVFGAGGRCCSGTVVSFRGEGGC